MQRGEKDEPSSLLGFSSLRYSHYQNFHFFVCFINLFIWDIYYVLKLILF